MALFAGGSGTGDPQVDYHVAQGQAAAAASGAGTPGRQMASPFDRYRMRFMVPELLGFPIAGAIQQARQHRRQLPRGLRGPFDDVMESGQVTGARLPAEYPRDPSVTGHAKNEYVADELEAVQREGNQRAVERSKLQGLAQKAGLIGGDFLPSELEDIWQSAIDVAESSSLMGSSTTPWDVLEHWAKDPEMARKYVQPGASAPELEDIPGYEREKRTVTQKHISTNLTDPQTARAVILSGLRSILGRKPSDDETAQFRAYLNQLEQANPTVSTTTQNFEGSEMVSSATQTSGGAPTPNAAFETFSDEEYEDEAFAYKMGVQGFDILSALGQSTT